MFSYFSICTLMVPSIDSPLLSSFSIDSSEKSDLYALKWSDRCRKNGNFKLCFCSSKTGASCVIIASICG